MISDKRTANAVGGKTARACDSCLLKRARWYCSADDAFLCQGCDTSVHSANQLASRHTRVRLETSSSKFHASDNQEGAPAWHQGFTRKARTPRQKGERKVLNLNPVDPLVPEVSCEDGSSDENDEQLLCRVPVFDPFAAELCDVVHEHEDGFISSDLDLAQFAADVESLLGEGVDEDHTKGTELLDTKEVDGSKVSCDELEIMKVKEEEEEDEGIITACCFDSDFDVTRASLNWCFDEESPMIGDNNQEEEKVVPVVPETPIMDFESKAEMKRNMLLRLNYESVITAWASQGSPWTSGTRPELNPDNFMGSSPEEGIRGIWGYGKRTMITDCEREARVLRYREKRRTRLFSKKIRYQVRKLNAEKRPRIKGRFVKRSSFSGGDCFSYYVNQRNMTAKS